jgi:hypothetical protein
MDSEPVEEDEAPAESPKQTINADVKALAQQIADECSALVSGIETLDANNWFEHANKLDALNSQLQALLVD